MIPAALALLLAFLQWAWSWLSAFLAAFAAELLLRRRWRRGRAGRRAESRRGRHRVAVRRVG